MASKSSTQVSTGGSLPGTGAGKKNSMTSNPAGKASRPKGKKLAVGNSTVGSTKNIAVKSGSSGKATNVTAKIK